MITLDSGDKIRGDASAATVVDYTIYGLDNNVLKQLVDGQLASTIGDLYTADSVDVVSTIILVNTDSSARTVNLYLTPSGGTARRLIPKDCSLGVGYSLHFDGAKVTVLDTSGQVLTAVTVAAHKDNHDPEDGSDALDAAAPSELASVQAAGEGSSHSLARADHAHQIQHSIADNHIVTIDGTTNQPVSTDYAKFTASGLEGKDKAGILSDLSVADGADVTGDNAPQAHAASHKSAGADPVRLDELKAPTDVTTLNSSTSVHGLLKKLDNVATNFMNGQGNWSAPAGGTGATIVHKTSDETVNDSDTLQNDDTLLFAVAANEKWEATFYVLVVGTATSDFKVTFTVPSGATGYYALEGPGQETYAFAAARVVNLAGTDEYFYAFHVVVVNSTNAGNLQFQWAQSTATAEDTKVKTNSLLVAHEIT